MKDFPEGHDGHLVKTDIYYCPNCKKTFTYNGVPIIEMTKQDYENDRAKGYGAKWAV